MKKTLRLFQWVFLLAGAAALGYFLFAIFDAHIYQAREQDSFEELRRNRDDSASSSASANKGDPNLIGRLIVPRLKLSVMVRNGVDAKTLRRAAGRIPGTARPGESGNLGIAGHRDSFFRGLRDVRKNDHIRLTTLDASYEYQVDSIQIVRPQDVSVLKDPGHSALTLVTCYPFDFIGSAPKRYIVHARQVASAERVAFAR